MGEGTLNTGVMGKGLKSYSCKETVKYAMNSKIKSFFFFFLFVRREHYSRSQRSILIQYFLKTMCQWKLVINKQKRLCLYNFTVVNRNRVLMEKNIWNSYSLRISFFFSHEDVFYDLGCRIHWFVHDSFKVSNLL